MDRFTPQFFTSEESSPESQESGFQQEFQPEDFNASSEPPSVEKKTFSFDNETQRNFDPTNVDKARVGVQEIFKDAMDRLKAQAEKIKAEAQGEGFAAGEKAGFESGEKFARDEFTPFLKTLEELVRELSEFRQMMYAKVEREMIEMIVQLTKKVIHAELTTREDSIQDVIRLAVQTVLDRENMIIKVNPGDQIHAETYRPELHHLFDEIKNITIEGQPSIERGGCLIETNFGTVDAQVSNLNDQIDRILGIAPPEHREEKPSSKESENPNFPWEASGPESEDLDDKSESE
ncbi:MAG: hypothetical protein G3M70_11870 [Candidatus Nitronauta litoralis]|uniref:Flagellar assembly protein FliH n=1 Tax=Candidatus Nitronauta litoralis TaxID=2705533 RepID=A0A7T0BX51_9BACT|nr:MAG: hypothetical protein G3M70_11870 [Candidatus Nitronauta litoralis]